LNLVKLASLVEVGRREADVGKTFMAHSITPRIESLTRVECRLG
jgi:hypothetical protein